MKAFEFRGFGNYSESHNWDNGLSTSLGKEVDFTIACDGMGEVVYPEVYEEVYNENGGSRNVRGYVFAFSEEEAKELLKDYESTFSVKEYEAPTERPLRF